MLPRLQAEEALAGLSLLTAGGSMMVEKRGYDRLIRMLEKQAGQERERPAGGDPWGLGVPMIEEPARG
jgi:hypothetical protein